MVRNSNLKSLDTKLRRPRWTRQEKYYWMIDFRSKV